MHGKLCLEQLIQWNIVRLGCSPDFVDRILQPCNNGRICEISVSVDQCFWQGFQKLNLEVACILGMSHVFVNLLSDYASVMLLNGT